MAPSTLPLDIEDPSDWLKTTAPKLAPVESALRCQVCKDFFGTPMITSCSHTFCSLCIRRCLTSDGKCPTCRTPDQELRLRRNWTVQEIVEAFRGARHSLTSLATVQIEQTNVRRARGKRKVEDTDWEEDAEDLAIRAGRRKTRSKSHQQPQSQESITASDSMADGTHPEFEVADPEDGLAACPICGHRMKEESVFLHLDTHNEANGIKQREPAGNRRSPSVEILGRSRAKPRAPERLPQLNYSLMKDNALRKKLADLGIPATGSRALLIRRHAEWVNIVNANADSSKPKAKRKMLRELDVWDRSTGRSIANTGTDLNAAGSIMSKDFDGVAWSASHKTDFENLVSKARHMNQVSKPSVTNQTQDRPPVVQNGHTANVSNKHTPTPGGQLARSDSVPLPKRDATLSTPSAV